MMNRKVHSILKVTMVISSALLLFGLAIATTALPHPLSDDFIDLINSKQNLWKAGRNFPEDTPSEYISALFGALRGGLREDLTIQEHDADIINSLPEHFDPSEKWQNCPSLKEIRDQGGCGSCWAFGAVEAMTDRWCIHTNGSQFHFSAEDMAGCVAESHGCANGCKGRSPIDAWDFWHTNGVVSGGNYNSEEGCKPYQIPNCIHTGLHHNCSNTGVIQCPMECQHGYNLRYEEDKKFGLEPYRVIDEEHIKAELYLNGPLEADFVACPDLYNYKSGVYKSIFEPAQCHGKGHAIKLLGWGVENGTKYWLLANSWHTIWGELGGFFKFLRGENHMDIETNVIGGLPRL